MRPPRRAGAVDGGGFLEGEGRVSLGRSFLPGERVNGTRELCTSVGITLLILMTVGDDPLILD